MSPFKYIMVDFVENVLNELVSLALISYSTVGQMKAAVVKIMQAQFPYRRGLFAVMYAHSRYSYSKDDTQASAGSVP